MKILVAAVFMSAAVSPAWSQPKPNEVNGQKIIELTGLTGKEDAQEQGVFKVTSPRSDLKVTAGGVHLTPPMGLTSWAAFKKVGDHDVVMGDMVVLEDQVNPVMSA